MLIIFQYLYLSLYLSSLSILEDVSKSISLPSSPVIKQTLEGFRLNNPEGEKTRYFIFLINHTTYRKNNFVPFKNLSIKQGQQVPQKLSYLKSLKIRNPSLIPRILTAAKMRNGFFVKF